jgi:multiple sugar transport system ATP-binding protein
MAKVDDAEIDRRVNEAARVLDLEAHLERKPANLSGGQRQRVAMGRAIVRDPKAFLMDEPLSNLDAKLRVQMRTEVSRIQNRLGTTTVYVTHDQTEAMTLGDRVAVMRTGVLQQVGSPRELYNEPTNLFVAGFIGSPSMNFMPGEIEAERLRTPLGDVALSDGAREAASSADGGRHVIAGLRPEDFEDVHLVGDQRNRGATVKVHIEVLESVGSELYAYFSLEGEQATAAELEELAADAGTAEVPGAGERGQVVARLDPASEVREGEDAELWFDPAKLHLFDAGDGRAMGTRTSG